MRFETVFSKKWPMCYTASTLTVDGTVCAAFASEAHDTTGAILIDGAFAVRPLWDAPGGCMGIIQIPGREEFLAIQKFYPVFQSEQAQISWFRRENSVWIQNVLLTLPFVHRMEILKGNGAYHLLLCQLCREKKDPDDWSSPGRVAVCTLDLDKRTCSAPVTILDDLFQNHGLVKIRGINDRALVAHRDGIHTLSVDETGQWIVRQLLDQPCSDVALTGVHADGSIGELGVILPFHGPAFQILRKRGEQWQSVFSLEDAFGHAIWGGMLAGKPAYLVGYRAGSRGIYCILPEAGSFRVLPVEPQTGAANVTVFSRDGVDYIAAANRESGVCTIYRVTAEESEYRSHE